MERAEGDYAVPDRGDHLRVVCIDDIEASLMAFSVDGQKVTVVGAARSGVAAALLLAGRGARVTLTDARPALDRADTEAQLRQAGITLELGEHRPDAFTGADLLVLSPGVSPLQPQ